MAPLYRLGLEFDEVFVRREVPNTSSEAATVAYRFKGRTVAFSRQLLQKEKKGEVLTSNLEVLAPDCSLKEIIVTEAYPDQKWEGFTYLHANRKICAEPPRRFVGRVAPARAIGVCRDAGGKLVDRPVDEVLCECPSGLFVYPLLERCDGRGAPLSAFADLEGFRRKTGTLAHNLVELDERRKSARFYCEKFFRDERAAGPAPKGAAAPPVVNQQGGG